MKVILNQDVKGLGKKGEIVEVSEGYGRNFLLPKKLAVPGTESNINIAKAKAGSAARKKPWKPTRQSYWRPSWPKWR